MPALGSACVEPVGLGVADVGAVVGVELAVGLGAVVAARLGLAVGLGEAEWLRVGRACVNVHVGALLVWWCGLAGLAWCVVAGVRCEAGAPATPTPTRPVSVPAATLVVARTSVVRR